MQGRLFPLEIVQLEPSLHRSADLQVIGTGEDGLPYAIKRCCDGSLLPATELICTRLAAGCGLPTPLGEIAKLPNNDLAFASRWEGGTLRVQATHLLLAQPGIIPAETLSAIFAFDVFIANPDRHGGNFLLRSDSHHPKRHRPLAFDFSRAFLIAGWPLPRLRANCRTLVIGKQLRKLHGFSPPAALRVLEKLYSMPGDTMSRLCEDLPPHWLTEKGRTQLDGWWRYARQIRLEVTADVIDHET